MAAGSSRYAGVDPYMAALFAMGDVFHGEQRRALTAKPCTAAARIKTPASPMLWGMVPSLLPGTAPTPPVKQMRVGKRRPASYQELLDVVAALRVSLQHTWGGEDGEKYVLAVDEEGEKYVCDEEGDEQIATTWQCACTLHGSVEWSRVSYNMLDGLLWWEDTYFLDPTDLGTMPDKVFWTRAHSSSASKLDRVVAQGAEFVWYRHYTSAVLRKTNKQARPVLTDVAPDRAKKLVAKQQVRIASDSAPANAEDIEPEVATIKVRPVLENDPGDDPVSRVRLILLDAGFQESEILRIFPDDETGDMSVEIQVHSFFDDSLDGGATSSTAVATPKPSEGSKPSVKLETRCQQEIVIKSDLSDAPQRPRRSRGITARHNRRGLEVDRHSEDNSGTDSDDVRRCTGISRMVQGVLGKRGGTSAKEEELWRWASRFFAKLMLIAWFTMEGSSILRFCTPILRDYIGQAIEGSFGNWTATTLLSSSQGREAEI